MDPSRVREAVSGALPFAIWLAAAGLLSWFASADVAGLDSGEIGGAAYMLGVAHPTGFPCELLLLRAASFLPFGSLGFRQNLALALIAASVLACLARLILRLSRARGAVTGALFGACALLASHSFLSAAVSVEVYASALLFLALGALCLQAAQPRMLWVLFGFALGSHVLAPLLLAPLCVASWRPGTARRSALLAGLGAWIVVYLPLASRRDVAFDWGDPETWLGLWRHVSAARIREAYGSQLLRVGTTPAGAWLGRLFEQPVWCLAAAAGCYALARDKPRAALLFAAVFSLDVAYASWINPMGEASQQLAHASSALLALAAGLGAAWLVTGLRARNAWAGRAGSLALVAAAVLQLSLAAWPERADAHLYAERYGSLSPLVDLPPRAIYACASDDACAQASFAVYAEGVRPDLSVVPAQQLWDRALARRLPELMRVDPGDEPPPGHRAAQAEEQLSALARSHELRPLFLERWPEGWYGLTLTAAPALSLDQGAADPGAELARVRAQEHARFGAAGPQSVAARRLWSSAYEEMGAAWVREGRYARALPLLRRALELTPARAVLHTNLGVALEGTGDLAGALAATERAVELEPRRPTAWVNLTRLMLRARGSDAARFVLAEARRRKLRDERLVALQRALDRAQGTTGK